MLLFLAAPRRACMFQMDATFSQLCIVSYKTGNYWHSKSLSLQETLQINHLNFGSINITNLSAVEKLQVGFGNDEYPDVTFNLTLQGVTGNYLVVWSFGDGSANAIVQNSTTVQHDFPATNGNINYYVCATVTSGNCSKQICKTYNFGCGVKLKMKSCINF